MRNKVNSIEIEQFNDKIIDSKATTVVFYWAEWCNPCKIIDPVFKEFSSTFLPYIDIVKVNIGEVSIVPESLTVKCTPTIALFKHGSKVAQLSGAMTTEEIENLVIKNTDIKRPTH